MVAVPHHLWPWEWWLVTSSDSKITMIIALVSPHLAEVEVDEVSIAGNVDQGQQNIVD